MPRSASTVMSKAQTMKTGVKKTIKFASGVCAALGVMTLGAVVASGVAVKVVAESLRASIDGMKETVAELKREESTAEEVVEELPEN